MGRNSGACVHVTLHSHVERPQRTVAFLLTSGVSLRSYKLRIVVNLAEKEQGSGAGFKRENKHLKGLPWRSPIPQTFRDPVPLALTGYRVQHLHCCCHLSPQFIQQGREL